MRQTNTSTSSADGSPDQQLTLHKVSQVQEALTNQRHRLSLLIGMKIIVQ